MTLFIHLIEGETAEARASAISALLKNARAAPKVFAALTPDSRYAPTDWLMGPGCNCCLGPNHPRSRLLALGMAAAGPHRVLIDAGRPALADRLAAILRAMPCRVLVNIITV